MRCMRSALACRQEDRNASHRESISRMVNGRTEKQASASMPWIGYCMVPFWLLGLAFLPAMMRCSSLTESAMPPSRFWP
jgi:hypothetical protein